VFVLEGVVVSPEAGNEINPGMVDVFEALRDRFELWLVSTSSAQQTAEIVSINSLSRWFEDGTIHLATENGEDHLAFLQSLVEAGVINPGHSLWIDHHPKRTMIAVRHGIDAGIFIDSRRLYRDLWLWDIVPLQE
jgi:hypothetical protein